nr:glycosyltransferase family 8 protein [Lentibacter algarum]
MNTAGQVNIAFSADSAYLPHAAAMLRSLLDHADASRPLNLFFLHSGIKPAEMQVLEMMLAEHPNARLEPINVGNRFDKSYRSSSRAPSNATYNRFLLFDLLPDVEKLLYIDVDVIVRRDITALYDTEMGEAKVAAVTDWIMTRTLTGVFATADPDVPDLYKYQREKLGMQDHHIARYFNAGVVLFNFKAMGDLAKVSSDLMARVDAGGMLFRDQDILNAYFKDDLLMLDPRWNVFNSVVEAYGKVPASNFQTAMQARKDPWLIHYADGAYKPWRPVSVPMSEHYWQALIRTPFYGKVLAEQTQPRVERQLARKRSAVVKAGRALSEQVPILRKPLLKFYALVRHVTGR